MQMVWNRTAAWICLLSGLLVYTGWLAVSLRRQGSFRKWSVPALVWPGALGVLCARVGFTLLQPEESFAGFRWCYTTGMLGVLGGTLMAARASGANARRTMDDCAPALCLAMAAARLAQRWLGETGIGPILEQISFFAMLDDWEEPVLATWMLETIWCLIAAGIIALAGRRKPRKAGGTICLALFLLMIPQILLEQFRSGAYLRFMMARMEQVLFALVCLGTLYFLGRQGHRWKPMLCFTLLAAGIALAQFLLDGKILECPEWIGWALYALLIAGMMILCVVQVRKYDCTDR